jgi:hypothetical protein
VDADDIILPGKIANPVQLLLESPKTAMVYSNVSVIDNSGIITNPDYCNRINYDRNRMPSGKILNDLLVFNFISTPSVLINTEYARIIGGFDESLHVQDYYMWLKLAEKYEILYLNMICGYYRVHRISKSNLASTNSLSEESVVTLKYRYYKHCNPELKRIIARNVQNSSVYLYEQNNSSAKRWLTIAFGLNPSLKTAVYFFSIRFGIPFSFFKLLKRNFAKKTW